MISSYILMVLSGLGVIISLGNKSAIGAASSLSLLIFSFMFYEHFKNQRRSIELQEKIELNQRSLIMLLNDKKENKEVNNNE